jgi:hypothetical protein
MTDLHKQLDNINRALSEPLAPPRRTQVRRLPKKTETKAETYHQGEDFPGEPRKPPVRVVRRLTRKEVAETAAGDSTTPAVTLAALAKQAGVQDQLIRLWLRKEGITRPGTRWRWVEGSRELTRVRKALAKHCGQFFA